MFFAGLYDRTVNRKCQDSVKCSGRSNAARRGGTHVEGKLCNLFDSVRVPFLIFLIYLLFLTG